MKVNLIIFISFISLSAQAQTNKDYTKSLDMHSELGHISKSELNKQNLKKNIEQSLKIQQAARAISSKFQSNNKVLKIENPDIIIINENN